MGDEATFFSPTPTIPQSGIVGVGWNFNGFLPQSEDWGCSNDFLDYLITEPDN